MKSRDLSVAIFLGVLVFPLSVAADVITDQLEAAIKAYNAGDYNAAMNELKFATADLQQKMNEQNKQVLPDALPGWIANEAETVNMGAAMMGGGTQLQRRYYKEDTGETVEIQIIADSPMIQAMAMMFSNPMMMQSNPDMKTFRHGSYRGIMEHQQGSQEWEVSFLVSGRILISVTGSGLKDESFVKAYLNAIDFNKVKAAFAG